MSSPTTRRARRRRGYVLAPNEGAYAAIPVCRPDEWLNAVERMLELPHVEALRRRLRVAGPATVLAAAREWARAADHHTGRDVAVAHSTVASAIGYAAATVKRIMRFLSRLGLIIECARGRNLLSLDELEAARSVGAAGQTSVASTRALTIPRGVDGTPLPPTRPVPRKSHVPKNLTRRASAPKDGASHRPANDEGEQARNFQPRWPLETQRFAAQLVARLPQLLRNGRERMNWTRSPRSTDAVWSGGQHIGHVCALIGQHRLIERGWTVQQLLDHIDRFTSTTGRIVAVDEQRHPLRWFSWLITHALGSDEASPSARSDNERTERRRMEATRIAADAERRARIEADRDSIDAIIAAMHRDFPRSPVATAPQS